MLVVEFYNVIFVKFVILVCLCLWLISSVFIFVVFVVLVLVMMLDRNRMLMGEIFSVLVIRMYDIVLCFGFVVVLN